MKNTLKPSASRNRRGFTLVELLVVVTIIGILAAFAAPRYADSIQKAQISKQKAVIASIEKAKDAYYAELLQAGNTAGIDAFNKATTDQVKLNLLKDYLAKTSADANTGATLADLTKGTGKTVLNIGTLPDATGNNRTLALFNP